jgi:hypothetical protein
MSGDYLFLLKRIEKKMDTINDNLISFFFFQTIIIIVCTLAIYFRVKNG